jgi:hypothetical protein
MWPATTRWPLRDASFCTRQPDTTLPIGEFLGKSRHYSGKECRVKDPTAPDTPWPFDEVHRDVSGECRVPTRHYKSA